MDHDLEWIIPHPGNIWNLDFYKLLVSWKIWKLKSSTFSIILEILEIRFFWFPHILEILEILFSYIFGFLQKRRAPEFHAGRTDVWAEISHMGPIQARKLKLFQTWNSKWRRRRRRPNNSPIWPEPWTITPRDQISRSGSIPHFDKLHRLSWTSRNKNSHLCKRPQTCWRIPLPTSQSFTSPSVRMISKNSKIKHVVHLMLTK